MILSPYPNQSVNRNHRGNSEPRFRRMRMRSKLQTGKYTAKEIASEFGYSIEHVRRTARKLKVTPLRDVAGYSQFFDSIAVGTVVPYNGISTTDVLKHAANDRRIRVKTWKLGEQIWVARY